MTKEQAIEILRQPDRIGCHLIKANDEESNKYNQESIEALDMAIKALEQQPCDDCVSRQAVIEYIKNSGAELGHDIENEGVVEDILDMPPVTPTHCMAEVKFSKEDLREICNERIEIACKDCKNALKKLEKIEQIVNCWEGTNVLPENDWKYISEIKKVLEQ